MKLYLRPFEDDSYLLRLHNMHPLNQVHLFLLRTPSLWEVNGR